MGIPANEQRKGFNFILTFETLLISTAHELLIVSQIDIPFYRLAANKSQVYKIVG